MMESVRAALLLTVSSLFGCVQPLPPPTCSVAPTSLDFREVDATGLGKSVSLRVRNNEAAFLRVTLSPLSFPFVVQPDRPLVVPASGSQEVTVTFAPPDGRLYVDELLIRSADGACDLKVPLRGLGSGKLRAVPPEAEFILNKGETQTHELRIENTRRVPLTLDFAAQPAITVSFPDGREIAAGGSLPVQVTATLDDWVRKDVGMLIGSRLEQLNIPVKLIPASPRMEVTPLAIDIPVVGVDLNSVPRGFAERIIRVRNVGSSGDPGAPSLTVTGLVLTSGAFVEDELVVSPPMFNQLRENDFLDLPIRFSPKSTGPRSFEFSLQTTAGGAVVPFTAQAVVLPACGMNVSPVDRLTLREVADGGVEGSVSFDNIGNSSCRVDGVRLSGEVPREIVIAGLVNEQFEVPPKTVRELTVSGPRQGDAGVIGMLRYHVFKANSDVQSVSLEVQ